MVMRTDIGDVKDTVQRFFAFASARHSITVARAKGQPAPWTDDPILGKFRFTNVFRELDATTKWCKTYVRDPLHGSPQTLPAVVLFRWFNRVTTGETLFCQPDMHTGRTPWEDHLQVLDAHGPAASMKPLRAALQRQPPPYVTGAYTINTAGLGNGLSKLEGVLAQYEAFVARDWRTRAEQMSTLAFRHTIEGTCTWLKDSPGMAGFMAYEVACDLRYTPLLNHAADKLTWANPGPGAQRGLQRVLYGATSIDEVRRRVPETRAVTEMQSLLDASRDYRMWSLDWPRWEMREVEHTLCEFDKYERTRLGQGRPRGVYST